jgi:hypothetical protein
MKKIAVKIRKTIDEEAGWETVVDFTKIDPRGVPAEKVLAVLRRMNRANG